MFARGFLGVVPSPLIATIVDICRPQEWPAVYVACSGTFRTERGLLSKFPKLEVHSNDVSLLSTALGMAGSGKQLEYRFVRELAWIEDHGLTAAEDRIAAILLALTYSSFARGRPNTFKLKHMEHMRSHFGEYVEKTRDTVVKTLRAMPITGYFAGDFRDHIEHAVERGAGVIAFPPTYKGGYERMYEFVHAHVEWQEPQYRIFDPEADVRPLLEHLENSGIPYFLYLDREVAGFTPVARLRARQAHDIIGYGRAVRASWHGVQERGSPFAYKTVDLRRITENSKIHLVPTREFNIHYLRAIYLKRGIESGKGDLAVLVYIDDMLAGAISYRQAPAKKLTEGRWGLPDKVFLLTDLSTTREGRIAKLISRVATLRVTLAPLERRQVLRYKTVSTVAFSEHPQAMKYRGSWKVESREEVELHGSRYKIKYLSEVRNESLEECFAWWWERDGKREVAAARSRAEEAGSAQPQAA